MELGDALELIRTGPQGPGVGAFFDFAGTVVATTRAPRLSLGNTAGISDSLLLSGLSDAGPDRAQLSDAVLGRRMTESELAAIARRLFAGRLAGRIHPQIWELVRAHRAAGHTVVIVTSAFCFQVDAVAQALGADRVLCSRLEIRDGVSTGALAASIGDGDDKIAAVRDFVSDSGVVLSRSYGYAGVCSDAPLLRALGRAFLVNPGRRAERHGRALGWRTLDFRRPGRARTRRVLRTAYGLLAILGAAMAAMVTSAGRDRRTAADRMYAWISDAGLRAAGVRVRVTGSEYLKSRRPAVFVFNHQSQLDTLVIPHVLRAGFTGVVAGKVRRYPIFGPLIRMCGATFIDRVPGTDAMRALEPLVDGLRAGVSVAIAPEGQVSPTPSPLAFKKGAFHLAGAAGVPIVPIVIRNSWEILWRGSAFVTPGVIDVRVLAPIDVADAAPETIAHHIERTRNMYIELLDTWRGSASSGSLAHDVIER